MISIKETKKIPAHGPCAGIYVHIPFCIRKCAYCDFLSGPADEQTQKEYIQCLKKELKIICKQMEQKGEQISTIYFGGGTPSILPGEAISGLLDTIFSNGIVQENAEITLEMNPGTVTKEKLLAYREAGINRLSIGAQSFQEKELGLLGRIHTREEFFQAYYMARDCGFSNISLDLMSGLPEQTLEEWRSNLETAVNLNPEHISAYSLIIEEGTPFYEQYGDCWSEENEEIDRLMYEETERILAAAGYERYEISNYAKTGCESRHNSSYWTGIPYYGCGLGASSLIRQEDGWHRTRNQSDIKQYIKILKQMELEDNCNIKNSAAKLRFIWEEDELLTETARMEEFMFLGLRLLKGISIETFEKRFHTDFQTAYGPAVQELKEAGLLSEKDGHLFLTARGLDLSNYCFEKFLL